ncbi:hypothetical protein [Winogradskyella flava]|uniref:DUF4468 domain-containing protein n=1 Tax=Winogradskyella flava TaxID=1884876 RepID=A0A842IXS4_9FLAO|nr:hypothetical protein [Winogradskyella flava]MBC2846087.1 hypothetical protein [Winogradskyella flava]
MYKFLSRHALILVLLSFISYNCAAKKEYFLNTNSLKDKTVVFTLQEATSYQRVKKFGEHIGDSKNPNIHEVFSEGIKELAQETKINLIYSPSYVFPSDSIISVMVSIKNIKWIFEEPKASMYVDMEYTLKDNTLNITGIHKYKVFLAGTKSGNLKKALKDGNKQLLSTLWQ